MKIHSIGSYLFAVLPLAYLRPLPLAAGAQLQAAGIARTADGLVAAVLLEGDTRKEWNRWNEWG